MSLLRDLKLFTQQLLSKWWFLILTLTGIASLVIDYFIPQIVIPTWLGWAVVAIGFFLAAFCVWRERKPPVGEVESIDADIRLEPIKGTASIAFRLPESYQLATPVIPPRIHLFVNFLVVNRGAEVGSLYSVDVAGQELNGESSITFQWGGLFPHLSHGGRPRNQMTLPLTLEPKEHLNATYVLSANITERNPERFAEEIGRLTNFRVTFAWTFSGRDVDRTDEVEVRGSFDRLKDRICRHWGDVSRGDLIQIARRQSA